MGRRFLVTRLDVNHPLRADIDRQLPLTSASHTSASKPPQEKFPKFPAPYRYILSLSRSSEIASVWRPAKGQAWEFDSDGTVRLLALPILGYLQGQDRVTPCNDMRHLGTSWTPRVGDGHMAVDPDSPHAGQPRRKRPPLHTTVPTTLGSRPDD